MARTSTRQNPRRLLGVITVLAVAGFGTVGCTPTDLALHDCLNEATSVVTVSGTPSGQWNSNTLALPNGSTVDARAATFVGSNPVSSPPGTHPYPVRFNEVTGSHDDLCMVGGHISNTNDYETTLWDTWHGTTALVAYGSSFRSVGLEVENVGDGLDIESMDGDDFEIIGARMTKVHDDCIENDSMNTGVIDDSYLECHFAFSARSWVNLASQDGRDDTFTVKNSLVYAKQMPTRYVSTDYPMVGPGTAGFFKWSGVPASQSWSPKIVLENVTFRVDEDPLWYGNVDLPPKYIDPADGLPKSYPITCTNVTVVWTGPGDYPGDVSSCATVTRVESVWTDAVLEWEASR